MFYNNKLLPSAHIAELFYPLMENEDNILRVIDYISKIEFYRGIELGIITNKSIANQIRSIAEEKNWLVTQWMTFELLKNNLNLASLDKSLRDKSIEKAKELAHFAAESGTTKLSMVSGTAPEKNLIPEAKKCLAESIIKIGEEVKQFGNMKLQIEPLDCFAHKKQLIGFTDETVNWILEIRKEYPDLYLAWDSAHVSLNQENLVESLKLSAPVISQIHLANAVLEPTNPLYGDYHMKFGKPGFLDEETAVSIIETAIQMPISKEWEGLPIAIEMRTTDQDDLWDNEKQCRKFLESALKLAQIQ